MWRVLIVEDDLSTREFFARSVSACRELHLLSAVATVEEACRWLNEKANAVDVLLTDLGLPDGSGLDVIRLARRLNPACEPLVISMFGDEDNVLASIEAGALGYIHKDSAPSDVAQTILDMRNGASPISPMIARRLLSRFQGVISTLVQRPGGDKARVGEAANAKKTSEVVLTPSEQDVLGLIARGFSYAEVARLRNSSVHTVQTHIKKLYGKLSVNSKNAAVFEATRMGLL
ncbi:response regulator transcription factor [uncultured Rhodoferax sp.]|uniref:response regulator transcription factor n=1 Tax=uncultured Rhodoferax sp. TaxID=223188 RepID=UPI0025F739D9|nr:response regulator transcription factor [uncultured Rhodoferax sp.]